MPKRLRTKDVDKSFCMTRRELIGWISNDFEDSTPVLLKCGGKNYRLTAFKTISGKPVLVGRRGVKD